MMNFLNVLKLNFVGSIITTFVNNDLSEVKVLAVAVLDGLRYCHLLLSV